MQKTAHVHYTTWWRQRWMNQTLLVMKLTVLLLTLGLLHAHANVLSQSITFSGKRIPVKQVFAAIERQTGYIVFANASLIKKASPVSIDAVNMQLEDFLLLIIKAQPFKYEIADKTIILSEKLEPAALSPQFDIEAAAPITGIVRDSMGAAISGVTVTNRVSKKSVQTNTKGEFTIEAKEGDVLIFTSIGYNRKEVQIGTYNEIGIVHLMVSESKLDEVQIIAYGTTTKRLNTGNIATVKADVLEKQPVANPLLALQGRVAGVFIEQASGLPGTGVSINIQGKNSLLNGNNPFYVVDGVPYISQLLQPYTPDITAGTTGIAGNPLNFINPADIESIEILKDADATAIYGSRAANGAVLITTKKGKAGSMQVNANFQNGWGKVGKKLDLLNTQQYLEMRHEALKNDNIAIPRANDYDLNGVWDTTQSKDWQKELIGGTALYRDIQLGVSGGTALTQYLVSGGYHKETSVFPGDFSDSKGSIHFNIKSASDNKKFKIELSGLYMKDNNSLPRTDLTGISLQLAPIAPSPYNTDGSLNWQPDVSGATTYYNNPLTYTKIINNIKTANLTSAALLSYDIFNWLVFKSSFGYSSLRTDEIFVEPTAALYPEVLLFTKPLTTFSSSDMNSWVVEPQLQLNRNLFKGKLTVLAGATIQQNNNGRESIQATGFSSDLLMRDMKSATSFQILQSIKEPYKYNAVYGRINYNILDKYIINLTARRDGSSRFGPQNKFHNFGAIGAAWIFSQTSFIQEKIPVISFGKLRASYGSTGSDQIGEYQYIDLYQSISIPIPYQYQLGLEPTKLSTPDLQWEETRKLQVGLDLGFLNDRILVNINYNRNRSSNQLIFTQLPGITGFTNVTRNFPALVENTGWEFGVNTANIKTKNFTWTSNINLTVPKNRLVSFANTENANYVVGRPITDLSVFHLAGINETTGLYEFEDSKGNLTNQGAEAIAVASIDPVWYGGFQNSLTYKSFSLDIFLQFTKRSAQDLSYGYGTSVPGIFNSGLSNQPITALDRWQNPGDKAFQQKYTTRRTSLIQRNARQSDAAYADASFIRLKNVSLSWQLPQGWSKRIHVRNLRLYMQAQNLVTITNYFGLDPESRGIGLPPLRVITGGIQLSL